MHSSFFGSLDGTAVYAVRHLALYIDAGSGAMLWQIVLGSVVVVGYRVRRAREWFLSRFGKLEVSTTRTAEMEDRSSSGMR